MHEKSDIEIIKNYKGEDYTKITFRPDYKRFGLINDWMTKDIYLHLKKWVYDLAGILP